MTVCARSWRIPTEPYYSWRFCTLPVGHPAQCHSNGVPVPPEALMFEDDTETQAELAKERLDEQKAIAKKAAAKGQL